MKHFWVTCQECGDAWVAAFIAEHGMLVAVDKFGESCTDCGGDVEIDSEYDGPNDDNIGFETKEADFDF